MSHPNHALPLPEITPHYLGDLYAHKPLQIHYLAAGILDIVSRESNAVERSMWPDLISRAYSPDLVYDLMSEAKAPGDARRLFGLLHQGAVVGVAEQAWQEGIMHQRTFMDRSHPELEGGAMYPARYSETLAHTLGRLARWHTTPITVAQEPEDNYSWVHAAYRHPASGFTGGGRVLLPTRQLAQEYAHVKNGPLAS